MTTPLLISFNNRVNEITQEIIYQTESKIRSLTTLISDEIDLLFDVADKISTLDLLISFSNY